MNRKDFFNEIKDTYFDSLSCNLKAFKETVSGVMNVCGKLETEIVENENGKSITFRDIDITSNVDVNGKLIDVDMSTSLMTINVDLNGQILTVEHGVGLFTPANKELVLFLGSIIGKKIIF